MNSIENSAVNLQGIGDVLGSTPHMDLKQVLKRRTILVATIDAQIRNSMSELLEKYGANIIWAKGMEEIKTSLSVQKVAACFCGFWLVDGTYRDIVRYARRQHAALPLIVVCPPACSEEHYESLAALNLRAFDFIRHPYQQQDLERALHAALPPVSQAEVLVPPASFSPRSFAPAEFRRAT